MDGGSLMDVILYINTGAAAFWQELLGDTPLRKRLKLYTTNASLLPRHSPVPARPAKPAPDADEATWAQYAIDYAAWRVEAEAWQVTEDAHQEPQWIKIHAARKRLWQAIKNPNITWQDIKAKIDDANLEVRWTYPHSRQMPLTDPLKVIQKVKMPFDELMRLCWLNKQGTITSVTPVAWGSPHIKSLVRPDEPDGTQHVAEPEAEIRDNLWQSATITLDNGEQSFDYTTPNNVRQGYNQAWPPTVDDGEGGTINNPAAFMGWAGDSKKRARTDARLNPPPEE